MIESHNIMIIIFYSVKDFTNPKPKLPESGSTVSAATILLRVAETDFSLIVAGDSLLTVSPLKHTIHQSLYFLQKGVSMMKLPSHHSPEPTS